jgi:4'-phosphopantetheinyl transferase
MDLSAVVVATTRDVLAQLPAVPLNGPAEARRRALRSQTDRDDFVAARLLAARLLRQAGVGDAAPAALRQCCDVCGAEHGRPVPLAGLHVSWSHSHGWVAAGVSPARLGVDVEADASGAVDTSSGDGLPSAALTDSEQAFVAQAPAAARAFRLAWTAKEACVKAGATQLDRFREFDVLAGPDRLLPSSGALLLSAHRLGGATAAAASESQPSWYTLGPDGALVSLPGSGRAVGTPA